MQNSPFSFALHPDNGILIKSFFDDRMDNELENLLPLLAELALVSDVRTILKTRAKPIDDAPNSAKLDKTIADISICTQSRS